MDYKVLRGVTYNGRYAAPGDVINDVPASSVPWLVEQNIIEESQAEKPAAKREPKSPSKGDN